MGPDTQHQVRLSPLATPLALQTAADKLFYSFAVPTKVIRAVFTVTTAITVTPAVVAIDKQPVIGSGTGRVEVGRSTLPITGKGSAIGDVVYSPAMNEVFMPGQQLVVELITASTAGAAHVDLWVEPAWEAPLALANGWQSV